MVSRRLRRVGWSAPLMVAVGAFLALLLPTLLHALVPTSAPGFSMPEMQARVSAANLIAGALAGVALLLLTYRLRRAPVDGLPQARAMFLIGALVAGAAALPFYDDAAGRAINVRYTEGGLLHRSSGVTLDGVHSRDAALFGSGPLDFPAAPPRLEVGPVPTMRGDSWLVVHHVQGAAWAGFEPPRLHAEGASCALQTTLDQHGYATPSYGGVWRCTATETGHATIFIDTGAPEPRDHQLSLLVLPVLAAGHHEPLDGALLTLGATLAAGAVLLVAALSPRLAPRADALLALAVGAAPPILVALTVPDTPMPDVVRAAYVLLALPLVAGALRLAWRWRKEDASAYASARAVAALAVVFAVGTLPMMLASATRWGSGAWPTLAWALPFALSGVAAWRWSGTVPASERAAPERVAG